MPENRSIAELRFAATEIEHLCEYNANRAMRMSAAKQRRNNTRINQARALRDRADLAASDAAWDRKRMRIAEQEAAYLAAMERIRADDIGEDK